MRGQDGEVIASTYSVNRENWSGWRTGLLGRTAHGLKLGISFRLRSHSPKSPKSPESPIDSLKSPLDKHLTKDETTTGEKTALRAGRLTQLQISRPRKKTKLR